MDDSGGFLDGYRRRIIDDELDDLFGSLPAILLDGPKGVGKTATALQRCRTARRLDRPADATLLAADPDLIATDPPPVLVDEWHLVPAVFDAVKRLVDHDPRGGRVLLTGSAPRTQTHSGAGRITTLRMRPLTLPERGATTPTVSLGDLLAGRTTVAGQSTFTLSDYVTEILSGGFPGMRHLRGRTLERQLDSYLERIVDHDLPEAGHTVRRPTTLRAWLTAYAAATGTTADWTKIRDAARSGDTTPPAKTTTMQYVELLTALRILDPLEAWIPTNNHLRALTHAPKHFLVDPALAARLVRRNATRLLAGDVPDTIVPRDGGFLGGLFEALTVLSVRTFAQNCDARVHHLRTGGARRKIDIIVDAPDGVIGIEVKLANAIHDTDVQHLLWLRDQLGDDCIDLVVVHTGPAAYRRPDGIAVIPLALLGP